MDAPLLAPSQGAVTLTVKMPVGIAPDLRAHSIRSGVSASEIVRRAVSPRRTVTPSLVQGLVSCAKCGYALYRTSTRSSARTIHYYRCLGIRQISAVCRPCLRQPAVSQDLLDKVVWIEVVRLLEDPQLIQIELDRRLQAARRADPAKRREAALRRGLLRIHKSIERLLTAYQEDLISLDELRQRMPDLRMREQTSERTSSDRRSIGGTRCLSSPRRNCRRLPLRPRSSAGTLNVPERQRVVRLLVKEIFVGDDKIVIRHSIPLPANPRRGPYPDGEFTSTPAQDQSGSYLLRSGRGFADPGQSVPALRV